MGISRNGIVCVSFMIGSVPGLDFLNYTEKVLRFFMFHFSINRKPTYKKAQIPAADLKETILPPCVPWGCLSSACTSLVMLLLVT